MSEIRAALWNMMEFAHREAVAGNGTAHQLYVMARHAIDLFDRQNSAGCFRGYELTEETIGQMKDGKFIDAIRSFRVSSGLGLKEAKDLCEAFRAERFPHMVTKHPQEATP